MLRNEPGVRIGMGKTGAGVRRSSSPVTSASALDTSGVLHGVRSHNAQFLADMFIVRPDPVLGIIRTSDSAGCFCFVMSTSTLACFSVDYHAIPYSDTGTSLDDLVET